MMSMIDYVAIAVEEPKIDHGCCLEKDFAKLIYVIPEWSLEKWLCGRCHTISCQNKFQTH